MYNRILVPLDGSLAAEEAVPIAAGLARRTGAELQLALVHVSMLAAFAGAGVAIDTDDLDAIQRDDEAGYLSRLVARLQADAALRVTAHHLTGPVIETLAAQVGDGGADLVVMTTHGRGPVGRFWLGSIADGLVRMVAAPVLLLRPADRAGDVRTGFRRVLIPLDRSAPAEHAAAAARALLGEDGECLLLHVLHPGPVMSVLPVPFGIIPDLVVDPAAREEAQGYLEQMARRVRRSGLRARTALRVAGSAATEILEEARRERVDAIVVTTHGVGGLRRFLLGSVVDKLIRAADVPVLVCRPPAGRESVTTRPATMALRAI